MFDYKVSKHRHFDEALPVFRSTPQHGEAG